MKKIKKLLAFILSLSLIIPAIPVKAAPSIIAEGTWGKKGEGKIIQYDNGVLEFIGNEPLTYCMRPEGMDKSRVSTINVTDGIPKVDLMLSLYSDHLKKVVMADSVLEFGATVFTNCNELEEVTLSSDLTEISAYLLSGTAIKSFIVPNRVTHIGNSVFKNCKQLENISIPESVTKIDRYAFEGCEKLRTVKLPSSLTELDGEVFRYSGLKEISIPATITVLPQGTFYWCQDLEKVTLPNTLTEIGSLAFASCDSLTKLVIPASVTSFGSNIFQNCSSKLVLYVTPGSAAEKYAKDNGIAYDNGTIKEKLKQPMTVSPKTKKIKYSKVKKKAQTFSIKVAKAQGKVTFKSGNTKYVAVTTAGKVTVKKKTPKGTYKITVTAAGNEKYEKGSVTVKVTVK